MCGITLAQDTQCGVLDLTLIIHLKLVAILKSNGKGKTCAENTYMATARTWTWYLVKNAGVYRSVHEA